MCSYQSRSSLREGLDTTTHGAFMDVDPSHEKISLRTLVDHSITESFDGEGRSCITARVYPKFSICSEAELYAFNNGTMDVTISKAKCLEHEESSSGFCPYKQETTNFIEAKTNRCSQSIGLAIA
ncbi:hypothetical protein SLA2020_476230 [Shorea laevis]